MLTIYIDFKSPASYLAIQPVRDLLEKYKLNCDWRGFNTVERDIPDEGIDTNIAQSHATVRQKTMRANHRRYAALRDISLNFPEQQVDTRLALGVLEEIEGNCDDYIDAVFNAYWSQQLDISKPEIIGQLIAASSAHHSGDFSASLALLKKSQREAEAIGIVEAPAIIVDNQLFIGREHLPWVEEIIRQSYP